MLTQPRFGVSSTMPERVSSGPGAPTPQPISSASGMAFRVSAMLSLAAAMIRRTTASGPSSAPVGTIRTPCSTEPSSETQPDTMLVPPRSMPTMKRMCRWKGDRRIGQGGMIERMTGSDYWPGSFPVPRSAFGVDFASRVSTAA